MSLPLLLLLRRLLIMLSAGWLAAVAAPALAADPPGKVADTIEQRMLACAACHGKQGEGIKKNEYYPRLAGKPAGYLFNQLMHFREHRREIPIMTYMVAYLSEPYLREIAEYYADLRPPYPPPARGAPPALLARGEALVTKGDPSKSIPACAACHGTALTGMAPAIPGLVGLDVNYVAAQMGAWKNDLRHAEAPDCMAQVAQRLAPDDISAAAAYLAAQPANPAMLPVAAKSYALPLKCGRIE